MKRMDGNQKKKAGKIMACVLAAVLLCGQVRAVAYGAGRNEKDSRALPVMESLDEKKDKVTEDSKDETVYVIAAADGSVEKVIVSDWLQKAGGGQEYQMTEEEAELPVTMKVTYTVDGRPVTPQEASGVTGRLTIRFDFVNNCVQNVEIGGKQEKINAPFAVLTGVILDSESVSHVEITNGRLLNDGERILAAGIALPGLKENLDWGKEEKDFTEIPDYVEITADVEDFQPGAAYVIVTNEIFSGLDGEVLDDFGGLSGDLDELKDAMSQLIDGSDQLYDGISTLSGKSGDLVDGVDRLYSGSAALQDGADELKDGAGTLRDGAGQLYAGLSQLCAQNDALTGGARQVFDTLLSTAGTQLSAAGLQVEALTVENYNSVLNGVLASLDAEVVYNQAYEVAHSQVEAAVREQRETIKAAVTEVVRETVEAQAQETVTSQVREAVTARARETVEAQTREKVLEQVLQAAADTLGMTLSPDEYRQAVDAGMIPQEVQSQINGAVEAAMASDEVQQQIAAAMASEEVQQQIAAAMTSEEVKQQIAAIMASDEVQARMAAAMSSEEVTARIEAATEEQIQSLITENMQSQEVSAGISAAVESARAGAGQIAGLKAQLDSYNTFYQGILAYTAGVAQVQSGAGQLKDGAARLVNGAGQLADGAGELKEGIGTLKNGSTALTDGVAQLKDGAASLADGLKEFDREGIGKLTDFLEEDLQELADRIQATLEASKQYTSLAGAKSAADGAENSSVRFVYKIETVK